MNNCKYHDLHVVPASPPGNVSVMVQSSTEIMVSWDAVLPINRNGIVTMYEVQYEPLETFDGTLIKMTMNITAPAMSTILTGLEEFVNYTISVRAYTSAGEGPYSIGITEMTAEDGR